MRLPSVHNFPSFGFWSGLEPRSSGGARGSFLFHSAQADRLRHPIERVGTGFRSGHRHRSALEAPAHRRRPGGRAAANYAAPLPAISRDGAVDYGEGAVVDDATTVTTTTGNGQITKLYCRLRRDLHM